MDDETYRDLSENLANELARLVLEATHYKNTGVGKQFLEAAIERANALLDSMTAKD